MGILYVKLYFLAIQFNISKVDPKYVKFPSDFRTIMSNGGFYVQNTNIRLLVNCMSRTIRIKKSN